MYAYYESFPKEKIKILKQEVVDAARNHGLDQFKLEDDNFYYIAVCYADQLISKEDYRKAYGRRYCFYTRISH